MEPFVDPALKKVTALFVTLHDTGEEYRIENEDGKFPGVTYEVITQ